MQDIRKEPGRDGTGEKFADPVSDDRRPELLAQLKAEYISADLASRPQLFHCSAADPTYPDRWKSSVGWAGLRLGEVRDFGRFWTSWSDSAKGLIARMLLSKESNPFELPELSHSSTCFDVSEPASNISN